MAFPKRNRNGPIVMEDVRNHQAGQPADVPLRLHAQEETTDGFVPLRLVLQPSGAKVDVSRPNVLVGRHSECDVRLPLPDVSRRHCRLQFVEGCWQVIDLNSLNGIQVNGESVLQAPLEQGDVLKIGGFHFMVQLAGEESGGGHFQSILKSLSGSPQRRAS